MADVEEFVSDVRQPIFRRNGGLLIAQEPTGI
jgi:hypothetical protein